MFAKVSSVALVGMEARHVQIEVDLGHGEFGGDQQVALGSKQLHCCLMMRVGTVGLRVQGPGVDYKSHYVVEFGATAPSSEQAPRAGLWSADEQG